MGKKPNYFKEAFIYPYHLITIITLLVAGGITGLFIPAILVVLAIEIIYLTFVPSSTAFQRYVNSIQRELKEKDRKDSLKRLVYFLNGENKNRFNYVKRLSDNILENYLSLENKNPTAWTLLETSIGKLDSLKESFLTILVTHQKYTEFLKTRNEKEIKNKINNLEDEIKHSSEKVKRLMVKRLDIQKKRLDRLKKIRSNNEVVLEQLKTIEEILLYIQEQSLSVTDPNEINKQLDSLYTDMECAEEAAKEMSDIMDDDYIVVERTKAMY